MRLREPPSTPCYGKTSYEILYFLSAFFRLFTFEAGDSDLWGWRQPSGHRGWDWKGIQPGFERVQLWGDFPQSLCSPSSPALCLSPIQQQVSTHHLKHTPKSYALRIFPTNQRGLFDQHSGKILSFAVKNISLQCPGTRIVGPRRDLVWGMWP